MPVCLFVKYSQKVYHLDIQCNFAGNLICCYFYFLGKPIANGLNEKGLIPNEETSVANYFPGIQVFTYFTVAES